MIKHFSVHGKETRAGWGQGSAMRCGTLDRMSYQQLRKLHQKGNESKSANQTHRNCREGSKPDRTSCAMDCGPPTHCCCSSLPWHRAKYQLDKDHRNQAPKPSSLGRCSMCSKAQHSTAQHQSCPVKVSGRQMIASRRCRTHHCSAAISAVMLTACCQCEPVSISDGATANVCRLAGCCCQAQRVSCNLMAVYRLAARHATPVTV